MSDPRNKQIKIQTGVVKRITKEKLMYEKEVKLTEDRIQRMKDEGKDEYDIKKMGEVLQESEMMVPETLKRLQTAWEDLKNKLEVFLIVILLIYIIEYMLK
jgi:tubulin-specific chaperone A